MSRFFLVVAIVALLALWASPLSAYTIYLQDGSRIVAAEKYRVEGEQAIITLPNDTETSLPMSEIDVERTEEANVANYGDAVVVEGGQVYETPPPAEEGDDETTLSDVASRRSPLSDRLRESRTETTQPPTRAEGSAIPGPGGELSDLSNLDRVPYPRTGIGSEIGSLIRNRGVEDLAIYRGSRPGRVFLEFTTNSEASVFRALEAAAEALVEIADRYPNEVEAFELYMATDRRVRAGQFLLTPETARSLARGEVEVARFFIDHVQF